MSPAAPARIETLIERLLATGKPVRPAQPEAVEAAFAEVGLPDAPAYRALLARSNGLPGDPGILGVGGPGASKQVLTITESYPRRRPLVGLVDRFGWHTREQVWCRVDHDNAPAEVFADDTTLLHTAFVTYSKRYVPKPRAAGHGPGIPELLRGAEPGPPPAPVTTRKKAALTFLRRTYDGSLPASLKAMLERHDGITVGDLHLYGSAELLADPPAGWFLPVGAVGDRLIGFDRRENQWKVLTTDLDTLVEHPRYAAFDDLLAAVTGHELEAG